MRIHSKTKRLRSLDTRKRIEKELHGCTASHGPLKKLHPRTGPPRKKLHPGM